MPSATSGHPLKVVAALAGILDVLSKETAPIVVKYVAGNAAPSPGAPFIVVGDEPPVGAEQRVRFDRGRIAITNRSGATLLDVAGLTGAVAQIVTSNSFSGLWIKPLSADGSLPLSPTIGLDRGDVAFLDKTGVALALSTERGHAAAGFLRRARILARQSRSLPFGHHRRHLGAAHPGAAVRAAADLPPPSRRGG